MRPTPDSGATPFEERAAGEADASGAIYWPGDEEAQRAPGSALVLLVLSFVAGGLYLYAYWPLMAGFDWVEAITLRSSLLAVLGGVIMFCGGILVIRHGLVWATRLGAVIAAVPMSRLLIDSLVNSGGANFWASALTFTLNGGPAVLVFVLSFSPALTRWRRRRQRTVAENARQRKAARAPRGLTN